MFTQFSYLMPRRSLTVAATVIAALSGLTDKALTLHAATPDVAAITAATLPEAWNYNSEFSQQLPSDDRWWSTFDDPTLTALIDEGERNNYDVATAARRIEIARASLDKAKAGYYPNVGLSAGWTKQQTSGVTTKAHTPASRVDYFNLGLTANWEIDLFGKITSGVRSSDALYKASRADYSAAMVSLAAQIAEGYFSLRASQAQLDVARRHCEEQERVLHIAEARHEAGIGTALEVAQAKVVLYSTQASLPVLENTIRQQTNALAVLIGRLPGDMPEAVTEAQPLPDYRQIVATGIPAEILRRRPDIVAAEMQVAAAAASLGVAKKDFLPSLSISGSIGTAAHRFDDLFTKDSFTWTVAPTLSWTVFDGMARNASVASAHQQAQIAVDSYNLTVTTALSEVDNAMGAYTSALRHIDTLKSVVDESEKSLNLSVDLYKQGLTSFTNVVDSQLNLLQYQNSLIDAHEQALEALVELYKALGGGFQPSEI